MAPEVLFTFDVDGANYYPGPVRFVDGECTVTSERLTLRDRRGRTQHVMLRDITTVDPRVGFLSPKTVRIGINTPAGLDMYRGSKDLVLEACRMINEAMTAPERLQSRSASGSQAVSVPNFAEQITRLCTASGMEVRKLTESEAEIEVPIGRGESEYVDVCPWEGSDLWVFTCVTVFEPAELALDALRELLVANFQVGNIKRSRGFWCIIGADTEDRVDVSGTLNFMHNISYNLLTPDEFGAICNEVAYEVNRLEAKWDPDED